MIALNSEVNLTENAKKDVLFSAGELSPPFKLIKDLSFTVAEEMFGFKYLISDSKNRYFRIIESAISEG